MEQPTMRLLRDTLSCREAGNLIEGVVFDNEVYNPEVNVANINYDFGRPRRKGGPVFDPDMFGKTFTRENFDKDELVRQLEANGGILNLVASFDEGDTERFTMATVGMGKDNLRAIFNVMDEKNGPRLASLISRLL